ncbi:MAG: nuclear transport factor 2 family protein [Opitutaceae bacterium]
MKKTYPTSRAALALGLALLLAPVITVQAAQPPTGTDQPAPGIKAAVDAQEAAFLKAVLAQDKPALNGLLDDDFVYVHENGLISTKAQFLQDFLPLGYTAAIRTASEPDRQFGSTVFTISVGHLQLSTETPYPDNTVSHVWANKNGQWRLVHRHEAHLGEPIGKQLAETGGPNLTAALGSKLSPEVAKIINEREAMWVYGMLATDAPRMDKMHDASLRYVHVNGVTSGKIDFLRELMGGYPETYFMDTTLRQFGDTVLVLHRARYRHLNRPEQSPAIVLHAWCKKGADWVLVARHGTRFANY